MAVVYSMIKLTFKCSFRYKGKAYNRFPTLNEYINIERGNKIASAKLKKDCTEQVYWQCKELNVKPVTSMVDVHFEWHVTGRHDPDNIDFARKFILDGLVMANVLKDDSQQYIGYLSSEIVKDTDDYVVVSLRKC